MKKETGKNKWMLGTIEMFFSEPNYMLQFPQIVSSLRTFRHELCVPAGNKIFRCRVSIPIRVVAYNFCRFPDLNVSRGLLFAT